MTHASKQTTTTLTSKQVATTHASKEATATLTSKRQRHTGDNGNDAREQTDSNGTHEQTDDFRLDVRHDRTVKGDNGPTTNKLMSMEHGRDPTRK